MERLTFRTGKNVFIRKPHVACSANRPVSERLFCVNCSGPQDRKKCLPLMVIDRLAAYEDIGLSPEEIMSLKENWDMYGGETGIMALYRNAENKQLTLDELRKMDGEPVYVVQPHEMLPDFWGIVNVEDETVSGNLYCGLFYDYDTEWIAYRRKPEGDAK